MIETAIVKLGSETPAGDGKQGALRCVLQVGKAKTERAGVVKRMPLPKVLAEAFSAVLLRLWGLNVPTPYLVPDGEALAFASADDGYPSLKQRLGFDDALPIAIKEALVQAACVLSADFDQTPLAITCDEAIDNRDRNIGNILWDGSSVAWIDHELCLGLGVGMSDVNKLAAMVSQTSTHEVAHKSAIAVWMTLPRDVPDKAYAEFNNDAHQLITAAFASLVTQRLNQLGNKLVARFPQPKDLLSGA